MLRSFLTSMLLIAMLAPCSGMAEQAEQATASAKPGEIQMQFGVQIPLRDGVKLGATIYKPLHMDKPLPVVLYLSPYPGDPEHPSGTYYARRGYIYAHVDVRGRGDSQGKFNPMAQEANDGYDVVEWLAKQPWCNGEVAMWGGSYNGYDQWATASTHPPHLKTIVPVASVRPAVDFPMSNGIMESYAMQWLTFTSGKPLFTDIFANFEYWNDVNLRMFNGKVPFAKLDDLAGNTTTVFQTWIEHPDFDSYWRQMALTREQVANINMPVLAITGQADGDQPGTLSYYADHRTSHNPKTLDMYYLVIGPWDHSGTRKPERKLGNIEFGPASLLDVLRLQKEWYDWTMKEGSKPGFLKEHVAYYVEGPGAECWKYAESLETLPTGSDLFYLSSDAGSGNAKDIFHSGVLTTAARDSAPDTFISDPNDLSAAKPSAATEGADLHGNGVVYTTAPFDKTTEVDGFTDLRLWLKVDAPDTDLQYALYLVAPNGTARELTSDVLRARYRNGKEQPEPLRLNQPEEFVFPHSQWFSHRAPAGSRLRLVIGALNVPDYEKNWNSIKPVAEQSGADARVAHIQVLHDVEHRSTLRVPTGDPSATCIASAAW